MRYTLYSLKRNNAHLSNPHVSASSPLGVIGVNVMIPKRPAATPQIVWGAWTLHDL